MTQEELQELCMKKDLLLEASLLQVLSTLGNISFANLLLEKIKNISGKKFITKNTIESNREKIYGFINEFPGSEELNKKEILDKLNFDFKSAPLDPKKEFSAGKKLQSGAPKIKVISSPMAPGKKLEVKDFVSYFRGRYETMKTILEGNPKLENLVSINKISSEKQKFSVIGMVYGKSLTKNKNVILEIEDLSGKMKVLISASKEDLIKVSEDITLDTVLGFKGVGNSEIMFANEIFFPEANLPERKKSDIEEYVAFIGDVHFGSKNFLEKDFMRFIDYLNGKFPNTPEVEKIKYLFIVGDLITGIGNYPNQEPDLKIKNLEGQFEVIAGFLSKIRKDIQIILSPGNHDCVRLMEPQPLLDEKYAWPLYQLENVTIIGNPATVKIGESKTFDGFDILIYHGFSYPFYANNIPELISLKAMNQPEKIMKYLLKNRHLAPTHTSTQYFPMDPDPLLIKETPDIFVSGHTHKSGVTYFNNVLVISVSSWEGFSSYQEKFGNKPDHCKVPLFNLKTRQVKILDFETGEDGVRLYQETN